jgi:hypothetical protein
VAFLGNTRLVVSSVSDYLGEEPNPGSLQPKQLGVWSLADRRWESKTNLSEPVGMLMPWKEWIVSFFGHPKLIEVATGKVVHRWDKIYSGKQLGPIELGDPPPPPIAIDPLRGRFAVADSKSVTCLCMGDAALVHHWELPPFHVFQCGRTLNHTQCPGRNIPFAFCRSST